MIVQEELRTSEYQHWKIPPRLFRAEVRRWKELQRLFPPNERFGNLHVRAVHDIGGLGKWTGFYRYSQYDTQLEREVDVAYRCNPGRHIVVGPPVVAVYLHDDYFRVRYSCGECSARLHEEKVRRPL